MEIKHGTLKKLLEEWLASEPRCDASKETYRRVFNVYNTWIILNTSAANALGATKADVSAFKSSIEGHLSDNTVYSYMLVVRGFHRYAFSVGRMSSDVSSSIRVKAPVKMHRKKPLSEAQKKSLISSLDLTVHRGRRDRLILLLMMQAGLRCVEVSRLNRSDFYVEGDAYRLRIQRKGHTSKDMSIKLRYDIGHDLTEYLQEYSKEDGPMFPSLSTKNNNKTRVRLSPAEISDIVSRCLKTAGVIGKQIGPHSLRHTYGCDLVKKGVPIEEIQLLLGHRSPATTMIYAIDAKEQKIDENNPSELLDKL